MKTLTKENFLKGLKFNSDGLLPVVAHCVETKRILMLAYANKEALEKAIETKKGYYWSRSRQSLWCKGETSNHYQHIHNIYLDCDGDTVIYEVKQDGVACHTGAETCFFQKLDN